MNTPLFSFSSAEIERLAAICARHPDLTFEALQLGKVTINALVRAKCHTVVDLPRLWSETSAKGHVLGTAAPRVLQSLGDAFLYANSQDAVIDWHRHWTHRGITPPKVRDSSRISSAIAVDPDLPNRLSPAASELLVGPSLHLSARSINALNHAGLNTLGKLVAAAASGMGKQKGIGAKSRAEIGSALASLSETLTPEGNYDGAAYAASRGFPVLPEAAESIDGAAWLGMLPGTASRAIRACFDDPIDADILARRFGLFGCPRLTLQEIGDALGITRQAVEQHESRVVLTLRGALLEDDYSEKPFRFRPEFCRPIVQLSERVKDCGVRFWRKSELMTLVADGFQISVEQLQPHYELIIDILGLESRSSTSPRLEPVIGMPADPAIRIVADVVAAIDGMLADEPLGMDTYQIAARLNRAWPSLCSPDNVAQWVQLCPTAERSDDGRFKCRFSWLRSLGDKAYLVLLDQGKPLHFEEIAEEVSRRQMDRDQDASVTAVKSNLFTDDRFRPVSRTGEWKLTTWDHIDDRPITDIAHEALRKEDRPLHLDQLFDYASARRPGTIRGSISTLLSNDARFVRVAPAVWALGAWSQEKQSRFSSTLRATSSAEVEKLAVDFVKSRNGQSATLRDAVLSIVKATGLAEGVAYRRIAESPRLAAIESSGQRSKVLRLVENSTAPQSSVAEINA